MELATDSVGRTFGPFHFDYTARDAMLYALGVGAGSDELPFLYERHGPRVVPTFATLLSFRAVLHLFPVLGLDGRAVVQSEQQLQLERTVPPQGTGSTTVHVEAILDKGSGALVSLSTRTSVDGMPLAEDRVTFFVLGAGGFGGARGPKAESVGFPGRKPDHCAKLRVPSTSGIAYRLCLLPDARIEAAARAGRSDPHIDPAAARAAGFERPLLYALATLGYLARGAIGAVAGGDPTKVRAVRGRFTAPAHPGDVLRAELWQEGRDVMGRLVNGEGDTVLSDGRMTLW